MKVGCAILVMVALGVGGVLLARGCGSNLDDYMNREAAALRERTVPPDARALYASGISRTEWSATTSWEFEVTARDWANYREWATMNMTPAYNLVTRKDGEVAVHFTKSFEGDAHDISIEPLMEGSPLRVRVVFHSYAN